MCRATCSILVELRHEAWVTAFFSCPHPAPPVLLPVPSCRSAVGSFWVGDQRAGLELPYAPRKTALGPFHGISCLFHTHSGSHVPHKPFTNCSPADGGAGQSSAAGGTGIQRLCLFSGVCGNTGRGRRAGTQAWSSVCAVCTHPATREGLEPLPPTFFLLPTQSWGCRYACSPCCMPRCFCPLHLGQEGSASTAQLGMGGGTSPVLCALGQSQPNTLAFV